MRIDFKKYLLFLFGLTCLTLPVLPALLPGVAGLTFLTWILHNSFSEKSALIKNNLQPVFALSALFWIYLLSLLYTEDLSEGLQKIETSLSMLLIPIAVFGTSGVNKKKLLKWYVLGCVASVVLCLGYSTLCFLIPDFAISQGWTLYDYKFYFFWKDRLSPFLHTTYLSMYLITAIMILVFNPNMASSFPKTRILFITLFSLIIILLGSRAGWMMLGLFWPIIIIRFLFIEKEKKEGLALAVVSALLVLGLYFGAEQVRLRVDSLFSFWNASEKVDPVLEKSSLRFLIWPEALKCGIEHLPFGTGIGDAHDVLNQRFENAGLLEKFGRMLNAHNQYLQSFIAAGVAGILALLAALVLSILRAWKQNDYLFLSVLVVLIFNFYFESILQTQAGVMFYALLLTILWIPDKEE